MDRPTIMVQPFEEVANAPGERRTALALTHEVAVGLGRFRWLCVIDGEDASPDVHYTLRGAVQVRQDRVRIMARLVEVMSGVHLWAESFEGPLADQYELQDLAASTIAGSLDTVIQAAEARRLVAAPPDRPTPMALYLLAQPVVPLLGRDGILRSLRLLEGAITLDSAFGLALADAAFCLQHLDINGWALDRRANRQKAIDYARRALSQSSEAEAIATAAHVVAYFNEDAVAALALCEQATAVNPNLSRAWHALGMIRLYAGQPDSALECFDRTLRLNPRDRVIRRALGGVGLVHLFDGRFSEAVAGLRVVVQEFPHWATAQCALSSAYAHLGHEREALAVVRRIKQVDASLMPTALQFQDARHRDLMDPGLRLIQR
jgi:adenylate cyclase